MRLITEGQTPLASSFSEQTAQRDYRNHAILKLEPIVQELDSQGQAHSAQSHFNLIRENHQHSVDFIKELKEHFAFTDQSTTTRWQKMVDCKRACEDEMKDMTQFYKLRDFIANLNDAQKAHAEQYFMLVDSNSPLAKAAAEHTIKLIIPDDAEWEEVSTRKSIFRRETSQQS
jgi:hypothetical protein